MDTVVVKMPAALVTLPPGQRLDALALLLKIEWCNGRWGKKP